MSLPSDPLGAMPDRTAAVAHAAFPHGNRYIQMRDALGTMYTDAQFADLYPHVGQPAEAPWRLALVTIMQFALLTGRGKQRTDSTHIVAAVRELNRLEMVGETLHHALNVLAQFAPDWLREQVPAEWFFRYGQRCSDYRLPKGKPARQQLAETIGRDGLHILTQVDGDTLMVKKLERIIKERV